MCAGCAMAAASAATGFRTWLQNHSFGWLTVKDLNLTAKIGLFGDYVAAGFHALGVQSTIQLTYTTPPAEAHGDLAGSHHMTGR